MLENNVVPGWLNSFESLMKSNIPIFEKDKMDKNDQNFIGNLQVILNKFCEYQKDSIECLKNIGQRECFNENNKYKYCLSKFHDHILCMPEHKKISDCLNRKSIDIVLNTYNIK